MLWNSRIFVVGLLEELVLRIIEELRKLGYSNVIEVDPEDFSLLNRESVEEVFGYERPEYVFFVSLPSARQGLFLEEDTEAPPHASEVCETLYQMCQSELNVIHTALEYRCRKLLFIGSPEGLGHRYCSNICTEEGACFLSLPLPILKSIAAIESFAARCIEIMNMPLTK